MQRSSSTEKMLLTLVFPKVLLGKPGDITFVTNSYLAYFLRGALELPLLEKPLEMVFVL